MRAFLLRLVALLSLSAPVQAFETNAQTAWVYDVATGTVLMEKNADQQIPPASMSKLMTIYMLFEALREGRVQMDTRLPVSTKARQMQGSTMFLNEQDRPTVDELIKGIIVLSGNDACVVVAEGLSGTEAAFARQMTQKGKEIGLTNSVFTNSSGWPDPDHLMTARDLGTLAVRLIRDFPELYKNFAIREFGFDGRAPANRFNRNPLLSLGIGADGLKTGHTQEAGYGLVGSAVQNGRRVVFVITGLSGETARAEEAERIVNWSFRQFTMKKLVPAGETVVEAPVWLGTQDRLGLTTDEGVNVLIPAGAQDSVKVEAVYDSPIPAPIAKGDEVGRLVVTVPGAKDAVTPLIAAQDVPAAGFMGRMKGAVTRLGNKAVQAAGL
ncbi:MAG: D-alanyl-D-alanine carboxypeptidase [Paracoccus sp.]|uniref:D-alanyl-D-alanine carboxypeptidase family protein n=1 Tax=unclassified Paracoccus (in: a-proteobacteria) TaxID=2688777 RepID=UPI000C660A81|nr:MULTISPECIES: D-alanyl-D-alanine carboxypeptidase family protein [unclassified Paracoccus (in: a-proteobacteria)]MAN55849.1 D-alanyl-D-alanine carboxypeptidase [Paracoccus sp. (in: a-proteobacteria)]MBA49874.1 D-alanyl-D-alanine carboxypeptidase [Paracoccus sp. (in: a-proteobacteria)]|tara:strand:- start:2911 stop:4056 length:1146 start_codon:yes stop_codon:yes gene_type:complete